MVISTFTRTNAEIVGPIVFFTEFFTESNKSETIYIANDWQGGYKKCLDKEDYSRIGYIGRGSAKQVIYVCSSCYCT